MAMKRLIAASMIVFLLAITPSFAANKIVDAQIDTHCTLTECWTSVDLGKHLDTTTLNTAKSLDMKTKLPTLTSVKSMDLKKVGNIINITGKIEPGSSQYWTMAIAELGIIIDPWWNSTFPYCMDLYIDNSGNANSLLDYPKVINISYKIGMQTDFDDIRIINGDCVNGGTELPYYLQNKSNSNYANIWARLDNIASNSVSTFAVYYGNPSVSSASNLATTCPAGFVDGQCLESLETFETAPNGWYNYSDGLILSVNSGVVGFCSINHGCGGVSTVFQGTYAMDCGCPWSIGNSPVWLYKSFNMSSGISVAYTLANAYIVDPSGRGSGPLTVVWGSDKTGATGNTLDSKSITSTFSFENRTGSYANTLSGNQYLTVRVGQGDIGWAIDYMKIWKSTSTEPTYSFGEIIQDDMPFATNISSSTNVSGATATMRAYWNTTDILSGYIFSSNNSGTWINSSFIPFSANTTGATATSNIVLNSTIGSLINWIMYANNSLNNWGSTGVQSITTDGNLKVRAYDEKALGSIPFNITIYNSSTSINSLNQTYYVGSVPSGNITVSIESDGYTPRNWYYRPKDISSIDILNAYLISSEEGVYVTYWAYSSSNPIGEPNTIISFNRTIGSSNVMVAQTLSDFEGKGTVYLDPYTYYSILAQNSLFNWTADSYSPNPNIVLRIQLEGNATGGGNYTWIFENLAYNLKPTDIYIRNSTDNLTLINFTLLSSDSLLEYWGFKIINQTGGTIYSTNSTDAAGGSQTVFYNMTGREGQTFIVNTWIKKEGYDFWSFNRTYIVYKRSSYLPEALEGITSPSGLGLSALVGNLIGLFAAFTVAAAYKRGTGQGASIPYLLVLLLFVFVGLFDYLTFILLAVIGVIFMSGGRYW